MPFDYSVLDPKGGALKHVNLNYRLKGFMFHTLNRLFLVICLQGKDTR